MAKLLPWATSAALVTAGLLVAASLLFIGRYEISATSYGFGFAETAGGDETKETDATVYRLDRWTGEIDVCTMGGADMQKWADRIKNEGVTTVTCQMPVLH